MNEPARENATQFLAQITEGDSEAISKLIPLVYDELKGIAALHLSRERRGHTLQPTALIHEAFIRLIKQDRMDWKGRTHFLAIAAKEIRRVLIDHARGEERIKRGRGWTRITIDDAVLPIRDREFDILDIEEALGELKALDERQARVVELRFFAGLNIEEVAAVLRISPKTVEKDWRMARAWFCQRLKGGFTNS